MFRHLIVPFGIINWCIGILLYIAAFGESHVVAMLPKFSPAFFITGIIAFIPFVITYTKCGLNYPEGGGQPLGEKSRLAHDRAVKEADSNHARLKKIRPSWKYSYNSIIGLCVISWFIFVICSLANISTVMNPFLTFLATSFLLSGMWFTFTYKSAKTLNESKSSH